MTPKAKQSRELGQLATSNTVDAAATTMHTVHTYTTTFNVHTSSNSSRLSVHAKHTARASNAGGCHDKAQQRMNFW